MLGNVVLLRESRRPRFPPPAEQGQGLGGVSRRSARPAPLRSASRRVRAEPPRRPPVLWVKKAAEGPEFEGAQQLAAPPRPPPRQRQRSPRRPSAVPAATGAAVETLRDLRCRGEGSRLVGPAGECCLVPTRPGTALFNKGAAALLPGIRPAERAVALGFFRPDIRFHQMFVVLVVFFFLHKKSKE